MIKIIIGKNGSGKTTFLKKQWNNKKNTCYIRGKAETPGNSILSKLTINELIETSNEKTYKENVKKILTEFKMLENLNKKIGVLSGGELKITNIALALGNYPKQAYIDEPERDLSNKNVNKFVKLINSLSKQIDFTIVTHDKEIFKKIKKDETWLMKNFALEKIENRNWGVLWEMK